MVTYFVRAPGTCGEFLQGSLDMQKFLVTCPINRYSYAMSRVTHSFSHKYCALQPKALAARQKVIALLGIKPQEAAPIYVRSEILQGKGMASSSADISVAAMATALAHGRPLELGELEQIALSIEPSDAAFYPYIVQFDYIQGRISRPLGVCPPMKILIFDEGGAVDTVTFNNRPDLGALIAEKEGLIEEALALFEKGMITHNISLLGQAATISAFANQRILPKQSLYSFHELGQFYNSLGTIIAHSGTIMGLLFPADASGLEACCREIAVQLPNLTYVDIVETSCEGITFMQR